MVAGKHRSLSSLLIDRKVIDHGLYCKWDAALHLLPGLTHDVLHADLCLLFAVGVEQEAHTAAAHTTEHPEAPEIVTEFFTGPADQSIRIQIGRPRNNGLDRTVEVALQTTTEGADVTALELTGDLMEDPDGLTAAEPLCVTTQEVLLSNHLQNWTDILRHSAVHEDQALLQSLAGFSRDFGFGKYPVVRKQTSAADAKLGIALRGKDTMD